MAERRPNILFINVDQLSMEAIAAHGCEYVSTPNLDRLAAQGTSFRESHCADPICCPTRASWFTGRTSCEHAVVYNNTPIRPDLPDLAQWLGDRGYETVHSGKWHVPGRELVDSFDIVFGEHWAGEYADESVARAAEAYLWNRTSDDPFFLVVGFLQPHDICYWVFQNPLPLDRLPSPEVLAHPPPLPPNFRCDMPEPQRAREQGSHRIGSGVPSYTRHWTDEHWRYYLWAYYRHVEMVDGAVGHVLDALEDSGHRHDTIVIFAGDHGEAQARHGKVLKDFLYDEVVKVPLIYSWPGRIQDNCQDATHLVSGLDLLPTVCDFAGVEPPPDQRGRSLRPLLEGRQAEWREFIAAESYVTGRMIRTPQYKYITYRNDPIEQLFDMQHDPWETTNLAADPAFSPVLADHKKLLAEWESTLKPAPPPPGGWLRND
jgi:arylsulfatase A-like enzyme